MADPTDEVPVTDDAAPVVDAPVVAVVVPGTMNVELPEDCTEEELAELEQIQKLLEESIAISLGKDPIDVTVTINSPAAEATDPEKAEATDPEADTNNATYEISADNATLGEEIQTAIKADDFVENVNKSIDEKKGDLSKRFQDVLKMKDVKPGETKDAVDDEPDLGLLDEPEEKPKGPAHFSMSTTKIDMVELQNNHEALFAKLQLKLEQLKTEVQEKEQISEDLQAKLQAITDFSLISFVAQPKSLRYGFLRITKPMRQIRFGIRGTIIYNAHKSGDDHQVAIAKSWSKCSNMRLVMMNIIARSQILDTQIRRLKQHIKSFNQKKDYFNCIGQHQCKIICNTLIGFAKEHERDLGKYVGGDDDEQADDDFANDGDAADDGAADDGAADDGAADDGAADDGVSVEALAETGATPADIALAELGQ